MHSPKKNKHLRATLWLSLLSNSTKDFSGHCSAAHPSGMGDNTCHYSAGQFFTDNGIRKIPCQTSPASGFGTLIKTAGYYRMPYSHNLLPKKPKQHSSMLASVFGPCNSELSRACATPISTHTLANAG